MQIRIPTIALAVTSLFVSACAADSIGSSSDYATDSWASPTLHGELSFAMRNPAEFTSSQRFHGWHFTLRASAEVELRTAPGAQNLDTVIYLYNADDSGAKQGAYIAKNDNADGTTMASHIAEELAAGTYFLQVKATHELMTGPFEVVPQCTGAGCPLGDVPSVQDHCDSAEEDIGKCVDDSLDATEEQCAPDASSASAVLCCNQTDPWYCADVCADVVQLAHVWGTEMDSAIEAFPEQTWHHVVDAQELAIATCANPTLDEIEAVIMAADQLVADDNPEPWEIGGWYAADDGSFLGGDATRELVDAVGRIAGEPVGYRWSAWVETPCSSGVGGFVKNAFYFPVSGKLHLIESRWSGE